MSEHFAGIDWGAGHHQLAVVDSGGREDLNRRFAHDRAGVDEVVDSLTGVDGLVGVAIERSDGIVVDALNARSLSVYPISPRTSARARENYQAAVRKNDRFDAFVLADLLRVQGWRWHPVVPYSPLHSELRQIVRHRLQMRAACESPHLWPSKVAGILPQPVTGSPG